MTSRMSIREVSSLRPKVSSLQATPPLDPKSCTSSPGSYLTAHLLLMTEVLHGPTAPSHQKSWALRDLESEDFGTGTGSGCSRSGGKLLNTYVSQLFVRGSITVPGNEDYLGLLIGQQKPKRELRTPFRI